MIYVFFLGILVVACKKEEPVNPSNNSGTTPTNPTNGTGLSTEKGQYSFGQGSLIFKGTKEYTYSTVCNIYRQSGGDRFDLGGTVQATGGTAKGFSCRVDFSTITIEANKNYSINTNNNSLIFANPKEQDGYVYRLTEGNINFSILSTSQVKGTITGTFERFFPNDKISATVTFDFTK